MAPRLSVEEVLASLASRAAFHREQETFHRDQEAHHAQQEVHHREQRALHVAALEKVLQDLEVFRAVATSAAAEIVPQPEEAELPSEGRKMVGRLVKLTVNSPSLPEPFGPAAVAEETSRRFADRLSQPVGGRTASDVLRRMLAEGQIERVRSGRGKREALYKRVKPSP